MMNLTPHSQDCPPDLIPTRGTLLARLKDWHDDESWRSFFDTYWRLIYGFALQRGLSHEEAQEVVQETVVAVAKNIGTFRYDPEVCRFKTWLLGVTRSKIANQFARRARHAAAAAPLGDEAVSGAGVWERVPEESGEPWERAWEEEWRKNLLDAAVERVKRRVRIEQFQMFDLFVLKQWPAREVARTLGVTIAHVYVAKHRLAKLIRKEVEALEAKGF
jgi:RNA polymerase sigma-70 factor (ECF subfamily)